MASSSRNNGGSSTILAEPYELHPVRVKQDVPIIASRTLSSSGGRSLAEAIVAQDRNETLPSPTTASEQIETYNYPRINLYRLPATLWAFTIMGMNDVSITLLIGCHA